jgi:predicted RNase H-like HicB family nuclease
MREVVLYRGEDDCRVAECPSLPGRISQGRDKPEAIASIRESMEGYILCLKEDGGC